MSAPCPACARGRCEDCQRLGLACDCCTTRDASMEDMA